MFEGLKDTFSTLTSVFSDKEERSEASAKLLSERALGEYLDISVGTAQIIESPDAVPSQWERVLLINLRTLVRNIIQAVPNMEIDRLKANDVIDVLKHEMERLKQAVPEVNNKTTVEFYLPDYRDILKHFPASKPRLYTSGYQSQFWLLSEKVCRRLFKMEEKKEMVFRRSGIKLEKDNRPTTLLTSFSVDLLSQYQFPKLTLLESHTGRVKPPKLWNTKLKTSNKEEIKNIPFCKFTLQIWGDGNFFLVPHRRIKKMVLEMASKDKWHALSTESRIRGSIKKHIKHTEDKAILLKFL